MSLTDALGVAARNNRDYQAQKETVFQTALDLDLEANQFRNLLYSDAEGEYSADLSGADAVRGLAGSGDVWWQRRLKNGTDTSIQTRTTRH